MIFKFLEITTIMTRNFTAMLHKFIQNTTHHFSASWNSKWSIHVCNKN